MQDLPMAQPGDDLDVLEKAAQQFEIYRKLTETATTAFVVSEPEPLQQPEWSRPMGLVVTGDR